MSTLAPAEEGDRGLLAKPDRLYSGYILDLDGTVYLGNELLPGALEVITELRRMGRQTLFLSNNPTRDPAMYAEKLTRLGLPTDTTQILNTVVTMRAWLLRNAPDASIFVIGEEPLRRALEQAGLKLTENPSEIDIVVASYDRTFEYRKLQIAFDALWRYRRARLITTNPDRYCPMPGGGGEPDAAAIVAAIETCTGVTCEVNVGKPDPFMVETALAMLGLPAEDCLVVGDRLYTDVAMGIDGGIDSALVLTGDSTLENVAAAPPDRRPKFILDRIDQLLPQQPVNQKEQLMAIEQAPQATLPTPGRELAGKAGVVTGGARGIGRAIALELAQHGARVAIGYSSNASAADEVVQLIKDLDTGADAFPLKANVQHPDEVKPAIASVAERFGKIDFLVNNAGITRDKTLARMKHEDWNAVIDVNLHSIFNVTSEVLPYMLTQGYGRIVNISSVIGQMGNFGQANYATAKAGMIGFTKSAALEVARKGITVNCVAPGYTETEMVAAVPQEALDKVIARIPMGRLGQPEEMAQAVFFLIAYGDYITGQVVAVNGGMYM